jgi:hypothetical protein
MQHVLTFVILPYARSSRIFSPILAPTPLMVATSLQERICSICYLCDPAVCKELPDLLPHPSPHSPDGCHLLKGGNGLRMGPYGCDGCKNKYLSTSCFKETNSTKNEICDAAKIYSSANSDINRSKQF